VSSPLRSVDTPPCAALPLPTVLTAAEVAALPAASDPGAPRRERAASWRLLTPLVAPLEGAGRAVGLSAIIRRLVRQAVLSEMQHRGTAYGAWEGAAWVAASRHAGAYAANVLAVAYHLGGVTGAEALAAGVQPTPFAWHVFGRVPVEGEVVRLQEYLLSLGYGRCTVALHPLRVLLTRLFLLVGRPALEALTLDLIEDVYRQATPRSPERGACYRLARALHLMGLVAHPLVARAHTGDATETVDPVWAAWCARWRATSTLAPASRHVVYYGTLKAGRWLARHHPTVRMPDDWTRDLAIAYVAAVDTSVGGTDNAAQAHQERRRGQPLYPRTKDRLIGVMRTFFRDCQEWGWCARRFDPGRVFATPRAIKALIGPAPRVIADDIWAKLLWAGIHLEVGDLTVIGGVGGSTPTGLVFPHLLERALAITWLFAGLRSDELVRLRVGCIRWQRPDGGPAAGTEAREGATCLLDVPTHKTGTSYTKPVDPLVGEAIAHWEADRLAQPLLLDPKTSERVAFLFCWRGQIVPKRHLNATLIPALCRKAGVPESDARGRITTHRARSTIATQLYNAKEPMSLFELQEWLGHRSPTSTQHYARITPTTLAKAYADAGYFARNVRTLEVLLDRDAVHSGAAARGDPWQYYDLGHGYCTFNFFEQCPHRMACARCDFYVPKGSTKAQLVEAKTNLQRMLTAIPLTEDERAAVEDGTTALDHLLEQLADQPTPAGPTPRQFAQGQRPLPMLVPNPDRPKQP